MIPLRDSIPARTTPIVNYAIIAICSAVFLAQFAAQRQGRGLEERYGLVPLRVSDPNAEPVIQRRVYVRTPLGTRPATVEQRLADQPIPAWLTFVSCMFLHGGLLHFLGNMWFLYIFGDNVEDRLGHLGYALLYLGTGVFAGLAHYVTATMSPVPTIGASGAIAGAMGAYAVFYPHARVLAALPLLIIFYTFVLPAPVFLALWFVIQAISGIGALAGGSSGGVAWWAHIGGFVAGAGVAWILGRAHLSREAVRERRF